MKKCSVTKECLFCGKEFTLTPFKANIQQYCSKECVCKSRHIYKICPQCGIEYRGKTASVFCSKACRNKAYPVVYTEEKKEKQRIACKDVNKGENNPQFGKSGILSPTFGTKRSEETKKYFSETRKGKYKLSDNPNWKGGKSFEDYPFEWTKELKTEIRKRDGFTCFICKGNGYAVHHIDYNKFNCSKDNLITLCANCHAKTNHYREKWLKYFKDNLNNTINENSNNMSYV